MRKVIACLTISVLFFLGTGNLFADIKEQPIFTENSILFSFSDKTLEKIQNREIVVGLLDNSKSKLVCSVDNKNCIVTELVEGAYYNGITLKTKIDSFVFNFIQFKELDRHYLDMSLITKDNSIEHNSKLNSIFSVLSYYEKKLDKASIIKELDKGFLNKNKAGDSWGNPFEGFVGKLVGESYSFGFLKEAIVATFQKYGFSLTVVDKNKFVNNATEEDLISKIISNNQIKRPSLVWLGGNCIIENKICLSVENSAEEVNWSYEKNSMKIPFRSKKYFNVEVVVGFEKDGEKLKYIYLYNSKQGIYKTSKELLLERWKAMGFSTILFNK